MQQDKKEAEQFLSLLAPNDDQFTFQTLDEDSVRKDKRLTRILHGTLTKNWDELADLNRRGAAIYVTVNQTDLKGRANNNILRVRALFVDLDGAPLEPLYEDGLEPHLVVATSPGKYHAYWFVDGVELSDFSDLQKALAARYNGDPVVHDLPRIMRLPGFIHQKAEPFPVTLLRTGRHPAWSIDDVLPPHLRDSDADIDDMRSGGDLINDTALANLDKWVTGLWPKAKRTAAGGYRITSKMLGRDLEEDLSITPEGIVDFGIADQGDKREGRRTAIDIVVEYGGMEYMEAVTWLKERLGITEDEKPDGVISMEEIWAYLPNGDYIYTRTGAHWPATSIDGKFGLIPIGKTRIKASKWLQRYRSVDTQSWIPGMPQIIEDHMMLEGGLTYRAGSTCYNLYIPPLPVKDGVASKAQIWVDHFFRLWGPDAQHVIYWLAQRVQAPAVKINHALILGSTAHGIGKDTLLEPVRRAVGALNFNDVNMQQIMGRFTPFFRSVILRVNEARDMGDTNRYQNYDHTKSVTASPPETLTIEDKNIKLHQIINCVGIIYTTNYKTSLYLPPEDRRHYAVWSDVKPDKEIITACEELWWFYQHDNGYNHVAAYLSELDISAFDPKATPPRTDAFWEISNAEVTTDDVDLSDVVDNLGRIPAFTLSYLAEKAEEMNMGGGVIETLRDRKNRRHIPARLERCGYKPVRNHDRLDGFWLIHRQRQVIYVADEVENKRQAAVDFIKAEEERVGHLH